MPSPKVGTSEMCAYRSAKAGVQRRRRLSRHQAFSVSQGSRQAGLNRSITAAESGVQDCVVMGAAKSLRASSVREWSLDPRFRGSDTEDATPPASTIACAGSTHPETFGTRNKKVVTPAEAGVQRRRRLSRNQAFCVSERFRQAGLTVRSFPWKAASGIVSSWAPPSRFAHQASANGLWTPAFAGVTPRSRHHLHEPHRRRRLGSAAAKDLTRLRSAIPVRRGLGVVGDRLGVRRRAGRPAAARNQERTAPTDAVSYGALGSRMRSNAASRSASALRRSDAVRARRWTCSSTPSRQRPNSR